VDTHHELVNELDRCGAYLLHFGRRQDAVYIKSLLISVKLRWKKLVRRVDDKGQGLLQAYREDKKVGGGGASNNVCVATFLSPVALFGIKPDHKTVINNIPNY